MLIHLLYPSPTREGKFWGKASSQKERNEEKGAYKPGVTEVSGSHASKTEKIRVVSEKRLMV